MNQKNHYISTYQKDYTWPYVSSICIQPPTTPIVVKACTCTDPRQVSKLKQFGDGNLEECLNWSRMGPMSRLLEPKIYPKIERVPKADVTRSDQLPSICLKEEYPGLCVWSLKEITLPKEITTRVDADRIKTTYQADYSDPAARYIQRDMALKIIDMNGQHLQYCTPIKIAIEADCPYVSSYCHTIPRYNGSTSIWKHTQKWKNGSKREKRCEDVERRQMSLPSWKSEYQDNISKIGHAIMRAKLHHAKRKVLPVRYQHCTTSS